MLLLEKKGRCQNICSTYKNGGTTSKHFFGTSCNHRPPTPLFYPFRLSFLVPNCCEIRFSELHQTPRRGEGWVATAKMFSTLLPPPPPPRLSIKGLGERQKKGDISQSSYRGGSIALHATVQYRTVLCMLYQLSFRAESKTFFRGKEEGGVMK